MTFVAIIIVITFLGLMFAGLGQSGHDTDNNDEPKNLDEDNVLDKDID